MKGRNYLKERGELPIKRGRNFQKKEGTSYEERKILPIKKGRNYL